MLSEKLRKGLPLIVSFFGVIIFIVGGYYYFFKNTDKKITTSPPKEEVQLHSQSNPTRLLINGVKIDLPITENKIVNGVWETTEEGVSHLDISGNPGENGNIVLYGHNKKRLLGSLPYVSMGAKISVITEDGKTHDYKVFKKWQVEATDTSIALATPTEILTIYTCDGLLEEKRFVLQAKPI